MVVPVLYIAASLLFFTEKQLEKETEYKQKLAEEDALEWNDNESLGFHQKQDSSQYAFYVYWQFF